MSRTKIVYMCPHYAALSEGGSMRSVAIARYLAESGYEVSVVCPDTVERKMTRREVAHFTDQGVDVFCASGNENYRDSFTARLMHEIRLAISSVKICSSIKPDVIIASYPPAFFPVVAIFYKLFSRTRVVLEVRDLMAGALKSSGYVRNKLVLKFAGMYESFLVKFSDAIAIVSPGMKQAIIDYDKQAILLRSFNGIEDTTLDFDAAKLSDELSTTYNAVLSEISYTPSNKLVIYAGALTQSYDLATIISGFSLVKSTDAKLLILGGGEKKQSYLDQAKALNLSNVYFYDFVDRRVALALISLSSVGVHAFSANPHWDYVLGNKVFDYMACGTPVLFSGRGTTGKLIEDAKAGYVVRPETSSEFGEKLEDMLEDEALSELGVRGRNYVNNEWKRSQQMHNFLKDMQAQGMVDERGPLADSLSSL